MTIVKRGSEFRVESESGKNLGDEKSKAGAVKRLKQVEWFKEHAKCIVDPSLVKSGAEAGAEWPADGNVTTYQPIVFQDKKRKDSKGEKLDFPSTTKQLELKDVKQPEFPSTPFTGEAYSQSFHNPRPSNSVKDGTHVIVQGNTPAAQQAGPFRGEHGPDIQFKGSDYVPDHVKQKARAANKSKDVPKLREGGPRPGMTREQSDSVDNEQKQYYHYTGQTDRHREISDSIDRRKVRKSITIAGRKVIIKATQGGDNVNLRNYPIDKAAGESIDPRNESQKRKDWTRSEKVKEDIKAYDDAKRNYAPGNGPYQLSMDAKTAYLGRAKDSKPVGEYTKDYPGAKVAFDQPIDPTKKPKKVFVHLTEGARDVKAKRQASRSDAADKIGMKYDEGTKTLTKKSSKGIMRVILQYTQNQPLAAGFKPLLAHLVADRDDDENEDDSLKVTTFGKVHVGGKSKNAPSITSDTDVSPDLPGMTEAYRKTPESEARLKEMDKKNQEHFKKYPLPKTDKSDRPNPIEGGKGDDLDYDDVDEKELDEGVNVEQEHFKNSDDDEDEKRVKGADIAMDHLSEDEHYYTKLKEMERSGKEGAKAETKKEKLLKLGDVGKSVIGQPPPPADKGEVWDKNPGMKEKWLADLQRQNEDAKKRTPIPPVNVDKSVIKERKLSSAVEGAEKMAKVREETNASPLELKTSRGQLKAYTAKLASERKKNESLLRASHD